MASADDPPPDLEALTEVYFGLEDPEERDAFLELLRPRQGPEIDAFLAAMMQHDEDAPMRLGAAEILARRGNPAAQAYLTAQLQAPSDLLALRQAIEVCVEREQAAAYPTLAAIWEDDRRPWDERQEALHGMEQADPARTLTALRDWCAALPARADLPEARLEAAMLCFARHGHSAAVAPLRALQQRLRALPAATDLVALIDEALALI